MIAPLLRVACVCLLMLLASSFAAVRAGAAQSYVDQRVTSIPAAQLLHDSPRVLVDARRQAAASELAAYTGALFFVAAFLQIGTLYFLWARGIAARLRTFLRERMRARIAERFAFAAAVTIAVRIVAFPAFFASYHMERVYVVSSELFRSWFVGYCAKSLLFALAAGVAVAVILELVDRTRLWYVPASLGLFAVVLATTVGAPLTIVPFFHHFTPLASSNPVYARLVDLEHRAHVTDAPILVDDLSNRSRATGAYVIGFSSEKRIVLGDTLLRDATEPEIVFTTAREIAHYQRGDVVRLSLIASLLFVIAVAIGITIADRIRFRGDDDPLTRLPLVAALGGTAALILLPAYSGYARALETRADRYALALTGDRVAAARIFVRQTDEELTPLCPTKAAHWYFDTARPYGARIATATGEPDPCAE